MRLWFLVAGLCVWATLLSVDGLAADRSLTAAEPWRLWTGPLRHADGAHLLRDLSGLLPLVVFLRARLGPTAPTTVALLALGLPLPVLATFAGDPGATGYYGVSGLVHALCVLALFDLARQRLGWALLLGAALAAKLGFELSTGALWVPLDGGRPAVWGHAAGVALGVVIGLVQARRSADTEQRAAGDPELDAAGALEVLLQRDREDLARGEGYAADRVAGVHARLGVHQREAGGDVGCQPR